METKRMTVLVEARPFCVFDQAPLWKLKEAGFQTIDMRGFGMKDAAFLEAAKDAEIVLCGNDLFVNDDFFNTASRVTAVAKFGAGLDTVDISAATKRGIVVFHTPGTNNQSVADHTFGLILCLARKIHYCDRSIREGRWEHTRIMGTEIYGKTLGLIGLGAIGRCVARRALGFDMRVVAHDPFWPAEFATEHGIERMEVDELLKTADIVSLHSPLTPETRGMINAQTMALMKPGAFLINAARGEVVVEADLIAALNNKQIAGAALDVFEAEPPTESPLIAMDNVVLTPHTAAFTYEAMNAMNERLVEQILAFADGEKPRHIVNPEVYPG